MTLSRCSLCDRACSADETRCACGAKIDWLDAAPEALRAKLGRAARRVGGAVAITTIGMGCSVTTCAAADSGCGISGCAADASCAARIDAGHVVVDAGTDDASNH